MDKIFIGGSRRISRLNKDIKKRLANIVDKDFIILVGDANGVDKAVQRFLYERKYKNVFVYHSGDAPRNNIGNWTCNKIHQGSSKRNFEFYVAKDLEMIKEANYAFLIWDSKSKGTLRNIDNLLIMQKPVLLYFYPHRRFYILKSVRDIESLMTKFVLENSAATDKIPEKALAEKAERHYQPTLNISLER